jgi:hypothetical protein
MNKTITPTPGICVVIIFENFDSTGARVSFRRCHGIVKSVADDGYFVVLGGANKGQVLVIPKSAVLSPLPGGHFYFEESDEWVAPLFLHKVSDRTLN